MWINEIKRKGEKIKMEKLFYDSFTNTYLTIEEAKKPENQERVIEEIWLQKLIPPTIFANNLGELTRIIMPLVNWPPLT